MTHVQLAAGVRDHGEAIKFIFVRILADFEFLREMDLPVLVGTSRKSFLGRLLDRPPDHRVIGSVASAVAAILQGAHVIRVHDVDEARQGASVADAILEAGAR